MLFFASCNKKQILEKLDHDITVIQITINEDYLWSPDSGLFVIGNNGIALGNCNSIANYNQNWEFPAELTLSTWFGCPSNPSTRVSPNTLTSSNTVTSLLASKESTVNGSVE